MNYVGDLLVVLHVFFVAERYFMVASQQELLNAFNSSFFDDSIALLNDLLNMTLGRLARRCFVQQT